MSDLKFDHIGLAETISHWPYLQEEDRTPQIFRAHFMSKQLEPNTARNKRDPLLGPFQNGGTSSLSTGKITGINIPSGKDISGIGRRSLKSSEDKGRIH